MRNAVACCAGAILLVACSVHAKTVVWYHMDELAPGEQAPADGRILNAADPTAMPAFSRSIGAATIYQDKKWMPIYQDNGFGESAGFYDPNTGIGVEKNTGLHFTSELNDGRGASSIVIVEDDERLHLQKFTVEFMMKADPEVTLYNWCHIAVMQQNNVANASTNKSWAVHINPGGTMNIVVYDQGAKNSYSHTVGEKLMDGNWHHLAFSYDGTTVIPYIDYAEKTSFTWPNGIGYSSDLSKGRLSLGAMSTMNYGRWQGMIDEFRISDEVLLPRQFVRIRKGGAPKVLPETVIYQSFAPYPDCFASSAGVRNDLIMKNEASPSVAFGYSPTIGKYGEDCASQSDVPASRLATGVIDTVGVPNAGSLALRSTEYSRDPSHWDSANLPKATSCWRFPDAGALLATNSDFTAEVFFRMTNVIHSAYLFTLGCPAWQVQVNGGAGTINVNGKTRCSRNVADGKWHHAALVGDAATKTATLFVDYVREGDPVPMSAPFSNGKYDEFVSFNSYGAVSSVTFFDVDYDEVRVTRKKLQPVDFLHQPIGHADVVCDMPFDSAESIPFSFARPWSLPAQPSFGTGNANLRFDTVDKPAEQVSDGPFADPVANVASACAMRPGYGKDVSAGAGTCDVKDSSLLALNGSFTMELEFKVPKNDYTNWYGNAAYLLWNTGVIFVQIETSNGSLNFDYNGYTAFATKANAAWDDGRWHHIAYVYDKEKTSLSAYLDYTLVKTQKIDALAESTDDTIVVGGGGWRSTLSMPNWKFDNFRLTAKALKPSEFKTSKHIGDGDTVVWAPLDRKGDIMSAAEGVPTFSGRAWGAGAGQLVDATGAAIEARGRNKGALASGGAYSRLSTIEIPDFTAEFFVKNAAAATDGTDLVALMGPDGKTPIWSVRKTSGGLDVMATPQGGTLTDDGTFASASTGWAHVAVSFEPGDGETTVKLYLNHVLADTKTFAGTLAVDGIATSALTFGSFAGAIDELRITKGVCALADMLYASPLGMVLFIR